MSRLRLAVFASHPVQYYAPLYREFARRFDIVVFYAHLDTPLDQAQAGFGVGFRWDTDLFSGYPSVFLRNVAKRPGLNYFFGCDTPDAEPRLREGRFDAVLVQGWRFKAQIQAVVAAKRLGIPVMARGDSQLGTPRSTLKKVAKEAIYPTFLRMYNVGLYVGRCSFEYWAHYHYPEERLFFSPHCVDTEWFASYSLPQARIVHRQRLGIRPDEKVVLFAGKLVPFKRPLDLVWALAHVRESVPGMTLLVAGAGELRNEMEELAHRLGVHHRFLGFCNQSEMPAAYAAADLLVLPSGGRETWGLVANEALACSRPIVVSNAVGCAPDLAQDGVAGRTYPLGDVSALASAIVEVLTNPPSPSSLRAKSLAYGIAAAADGVEAALRSSLMVAR